VNHKVITRRVRLRAWVGAPVTIEGRTTATPTATPTTTPTATATPTPTSNPTPTPLDTPWVTGYYAGWYWDQMYPPERVDMAAMTHFVFGRIAPGGGSLEGEPDNPSYPDFPYAPGDVVPGAGTAHQSGLAPDGSGRSVEDYLIDRAHAAGTKALVMLGGDGSDGRGFMLSTAEGLRPQFVDSIVDYVVDHNYDGVDVDWENCLEGEADCGEGAGEEPVTANEAHRRLLALVNDIRAEADTRDEFTADPIIITHPGYALNTNYMLEDGRAPKWRADVANAVDQYNLMSYGIGTTMNGGNWLSWFSGALTGAGPRHPVDIASSIQAYVAAGVPRDRLGLGIGFFGTYFGPKITGPRQDTAVNRIWETNDVALRYAELDRMGYLDHGDLEWDVLAQSTFRSYKDYGEAGYVPPRNPEGPRDHLMSPAGFLTYEDARSIAAKSRWAKETGLGGAMLWTLNYGWLPDENTNPLLDSVKREFLGR